MGDDTASLPDPLLLLRQAIAGATPPFPTISASADATTDDYALATHLTFTAPRSASYPLAADTRFVSADRPVNLRSIFFAWRHKDDPIAEYLQLAHDLNNALAASEQNAGATVRNLVFVERLDLITWLEGASDDSEYITPLAGDAAAQQAAQAAPTTAPAAGARHGKVIDPQVQAILNNERRMGDQNTVLRGFKPTDFSSVRQDAERYLRAAKASARPNGPANPHPAGAAGAPHANPSTLVSLPKPGKPQHRRDPLILLSPSASSLLRMSNAKAFLSDGEYRPAAEGAAAANILHVSRLLPSIDVQRPLRFVLVDSPEQFKPDYWERVVAVFTTGQAWQFKAYKWSSPQELFSHVLGVYVGWRDEGVPDAVRGWGRGVSCLQLEKWRGEGQGRWRDKEVVETLWGRIEEGMRRAGWTAAGPRTGQR